MARLGSVDEKGGLAGRGEGRGDLARDMAGFAQAGDDHPPAGGGDRLDRAAESRAEAVLAGRPKRLGHRRKSLLFNRNRPQPGGHRVNGSFVMRALTTATPAHASPTAGRGPLKRPLTIPA